MRVVEKKIKRVYLSDYSFPGAKYAKKMIKAEEAFCKKIRQNRQRQVLKQNRAFKWTEQNKAKLLGASDAVHKKYLEMILSLRAIENKMAAIAGDCADYEIAATLGCCIALPDDDEFTCDIVTEYSRKDLRFLPQEHALNKECDLDASGLAGQKVSYPFYRLMQERKLSFAQAADLTEDNFYFDISVELE